VNIVQPYAKLDEDVPDRAAGIRLLQKIEKKARRSHRSEDAMTETSWERFLTAVVLHHGDWSVVEHSSASVEFYMDRGVGEEQVRHRLFSPTKESTRFVNYMKKVGFSVSYPRFQDIVPDPDWQFAMQTCEETYGKLIKKGWKPEEARSVIPLAFMGYTDVTGNLRNWRYFLLMRTTKETHPQMREVTLPLLAEFKEKIPLLYDDIEPLAPQSENVKKAR
jgi:thymidylate synthase (FAD)